MNKEPIKITRQTLADGVIQQLVKERGGIEGDVFDEEQLLASRRSLIPDKPKEDIWVFGYGSLIWNPLITFKQKKLGKIYGYHRSFCLMTRIGRGTPEKPGLVLGLETGGSCPGQILSIDKKIAAEECDLVWKREMINGSYIPKKVKVHLKDGSCVDAVTFVMNKKSPSYISGLSLDEKARIIASAEGFVGPCLEYLERTHEALDALAIQDKYLERILSLVKKSARNS